MPVESELNETANIFPIFLPPFSYLLPKSDSERRAVSGDDSLITHRCVKITLKLHVAPVAQLDSASASEAEGCGFKPRRAY